MIHQSLRIRVGAVADKLYSLVEWHEDEDGHFLRATFAGKTRVERLKRTPSVVDAQVIADDVSIQQKEHEEV